MNNNAIGVLISLGALLSIILILIVCVLRKYIQTIRNQRSFEEYNTEYEKNNGRKRGSSSERFVRTWFPFFDTRTVEGQVEPNKKPRRWNIKKSPPQSPKKDRNRYQSLPNLPLASNDEEEEINSNRGSFLQHGKKHRSISFADEQSDIASSPSRRLSSASSVFGIPTTNPNNETVTTTTTMTTTDSVNNNVLRYCKTNGHIEFTTQYFSTERLFQVHIIRVSEFSVKGEKKFGLNAWISVYLNPGKQQKTETNIQIGDEPFFNEKLQFKDMDEYTIKRCRLVMKVFNKQRKKHTKELLGMVNMDLGSLSVSTSSEKELHTAPLYSL